MALLKALPILAAAAMMAQAAPLMSEAQGETMEPVAVTAYTTGSASMGMETPVEPMTTYTDATPTYTELPASETESSTWEGTPTPASTSMTEEVTTTPDSTETPTPYESEPATFESVTESGTTMPEYTETSTPYESGSTIESGTAYESSIDYPVYTTSIDETTTDGPETTTTDYAESTETIVMPPPPPSAPSRHSNGELVGWWHDAGCTTRYPTGEGPNGWWRNHPEEVVKADMALWYQYGIEGRPKYANACFGKNPPTYPTAYLLPWWREAGCTTDFPLGEMPGGWWQSHSEKVVREDMSLWYQYAVDGIPEYVEACFGVSSN